MQTVCVELQFIGQSFQRLGVSHTASLCRVAFDVIIEDKHVQNSRLNADEAKRPVQLCHTELMKDSLDTETTSEL